MCVPSITILNDGRGKRQIRERPRHEQFYRPLSRDAYDSISETPPAGVVTARPSDPLRCPVPADYSRLTDAYFAGQEKEKARVKRSEMSKKPELVKKEDVPRNGEAPKREINIDRAYEKLYRRRRRSSASSASSRSWKEMKELLKEVLRRRGIEDKVRRQVGSDRKHTNEEREQRRRSHERYGDSDLHGAYGKRRPRHRERTPLREDRGYFRKDTHHWSEA